MTDIPDDLIEKMRGKSNPFHYSGALHCTDAARIAAEYYAQMETELLEENEALRWEIHHGREKYEREILHHKQLYLDKVSYLERAVKHLINLQTDLDFQLLPIPMKITKYAPQGDDDGK